MLNKVVGLVLKDIRMAHGLNQTEMAAKLGVTQSVLSQRESGQTTMTVPELWLLHQRFSVDPGAFHHRVEDKIQEAKEELESLLHG